jgi:lipid-A-disaccharide synthase
MSRRVFITAAEVSGDKHAAQLIRSLRQLDPQIIIEGFGGPEMQAAGAIIHRETVSKAEMGLRGALRAFEIRDALKWTRNYFKENRPDLLIGVDSPSMNFHFASVARAFGVPVLQYVAPQLWAWAPWRMKKVRNRVDRLACVLPFEEKYFKDEGVDAVFVGHPLFDELPTDRTIRSPHTKPLVNPVVGILPGSRKSEADKNLPRQLDVARRIFLAIPGATFLTPTTAATDGIVRSIVNGANAKHPQPALPIEIEQDRFDQMVPRCDLCITVSGTATLHVATFGVPMIVVYRISPIQWNLGARWLVRTRTFALVNLLAKRLPGRSESGNAVPEFVPWYGSNEPVANVAIDLLRNPDKLNAQRSRLAELVASLDKPGASLRTARMALDMINNGMPADAIPATS